jgi:hypothetical protein
LNTGQATEALESHQEALVLFQGQKHRQGMAETLDLLGMAHGISGNTVGAAIQYGRAIDRLKLRTESMLRTFGRLMPHSLD